MPTIISEDPLLAHAADLQRQLEETARAHGYCSYTEMQRKLAEEREELEPEQKAVLLKRLAPIAHDAEQHRASLPDIDATGLPAVQDLARSVARLVRVLLFGYTEEEIKELTDRMEAEQAAALESPAAQNKRRQQHEAAIERLAAASHSKPRAAP
ncbi:hypothetical protein [Caldimonas tepidiphila]|uniref:hypothetical protein n=1 Tax=Caldimonas tepidiphila TaxID=2315841 RepID=UPI0013008B7F|nr:hypothetical protein [Caldimonas tepidiphila]